MSDAGSARRPAVAYRLCRGDQDWALMDDGTYRCLRAGEISRGAIVTQREGPIRGRLGRVEALIPVKGDCVCVAVRWQADAKKPRRPGTFWPLAELEVLTRAPAPAAATRGR